MKKVNKTSEIQEIHQANSMTKQTNIVSLFKKKKNLSVKFSVQSEENNYSSGWPFLQISP